MVGSDSCNKNSGYMSGVHATLERKLKRALQRVLCLKHTVEVIWHHFFKLVDGETSGPTTLSGTVGKMLTNNHLYTESIVNFKPVRGGAMPKLSDEVVNSMSSDQAYLYRIVQVMNIVRYISGQF